MLGQLNSMVSLENLWVHERLGIFLLMFSALISALDATIEAKRQGKLLPAGQAHERIMGMYTWPDVTSRTEKVSSRSFSLSAF